MKKSILVKNITSITDIDDLSEVGQLLCMAIAKISTESQTDMEPDEILAQIQDLRSKVYTEKMTEKIENSRKTGYNPAHEPPAGFVHPVPEIK